MDLASAEAEIRHVFGDTPITEASIGAASPDILVKLSVHAPIKNNGKWREHTRVYGYSTVFLRFHWKFCKTGCSKDGKITQHYLLDAIWQRTLEKMFI